MPAARPAGCSALNTIGAIVGLVLAGRFLLRPLFRLIGNLGEREMFVFAGLFTVIASAAVMELLGLSTALGAFIAGVMLADSPYRHELQADVEPFRSILLGLFFLTVGMLLDLNAIAKRPFFVIGMAARPDRDQGRRDHGPGDGLQDGLAPGARRSACCSARAASSASSCSRRRRARC